MSTKVVLPNFTFPAQGPHPAVRVLWVSGGLLLVATLILGGAVWHRHSVNTAVAEAAKAPTAAPVQAPAASAEAVRPAAPAQQALVAAAPPAAEAAAAPAAPAADTAVPAPARRHTHRNHARVAHASAHGKAVAVRSAADARGSKNSPAKNDDAIDRLLNQFK